jgi:hypothetical protein
MNGSLTIGKRAISIQANDVSVAYGDEVSLSGYRVKSGSLYNRDELSLELQTNATRGSNVGTYEISARTGFASANPNYDVTFTKGSVNVTRRNVTIIANDVSASYGDDIGPSGFRFADGSSTYNNDRLNVSLSSSAQKGRDAGTYDVTALNDLAASNPNYQVSFIKGTATITPRAITVKLRKDIEYGDYIDLSDYSVTGAESSFVKSNLSGALQSNAKTGDNAGTRQVVTIGTLGVDKSQAKNKNYSITVDRESMITITPRKVTVVADLVERFGGEDNPQLTYRFENGRGTFNRQVLGGSLYTEADRDAPVGDYAIKRGTLGLRDTNYAITYVEGTLRVLDKAGFVAKWRLDYNPGEGLGGLKVGYRIGGSTFYSRAVGTWDGSIADGEKPIPVSRPRFGDVMVCTNPESDCSISTGAKDRQPVIFAR